MQLFVLDEDGHVVFEFRTDGNNAIQSYHTSPSKVVQAKVVKMIAGALHFLQRRS